MSHFNSESFYKNNHSGPFNEDDYENDDFFSFQLDSKKINLNYSNLTKYSKIIRETYLFSDVLNRLPQELQQFQTECQLSTESIFYFFQLLQQKYNIKENLKLTYKQCIDLLRISNYLQVRKLTNQINDYIKKQNNDVNFIIQMILHEIESDKRTDKHEFNINFEMEKILTNKINECLTNEKFVELPISCIYRIIKQSSNEEIESDKLFNFIKKSLKKFCVLFEFIEINKLSERVLSELCELYINSNENDRTYFNYLKHDLKMIKEIIDQKNNFQSQLEKTELSKNLIESEKIQMQQKIEKTEQLNQQIQTKLEKTEQLNQQIQTKLKETVLLKNQIESEKIQIQTKLDETEQLNKQQKISFEELKSKFDQLQKQIDELKEEKEMKEKELLRCKVEGEINASVKNGLIVNAQINLKMNGRSLDSTKSKYIVSRSDQKTLGIEAYEKGEPITSLQMNTNDFICKPGTYYIRCIIFDCEGKYTELLSNSVRTSGSCVLFDYEGKPTTISLIEGQYKLEVWGANGGDSIGTKHNSSPQSKGGLGGYSSGILKLHKNENIHVYVGGEGCPANSSEGSISNGGFPDGGGTKTGHYYTYTSVSGTGGGSTSIRLTEDTNYTRVIVAGGGGGASGCCNHTDHGGYGGGLSGGNSSLRSKQGETGSGTQTGSTCGLGGGSNGDPGIFRKGAEGKYKSGHDSGGGGGGGWYGGGSGGFGCPGSSGSGGGGSGWTFTETSFQTWKSGDSSNSLKFGLNSSYYLTDTVTLSGNNEIPKPDGNGTELGHSGNGYAKITPL